MVRGDRQLVGAAAGVSVGSAVVLAAAIAAVTAWALRDNAEFLPSGPTVPNLVAAAGHGHTTGGYVPPPAILGEALANYAGLGMVALHALLIAVIAVAYCLRRVLRRSTVDTNGVLVTVIFAASVAVTSALVAACMATVLLGAAISFTATLTTALIVLRYSFVLTLAVTAVLGLP
jgi:hypothetical protein